MKRKFVGFLAGVGLVGLGVFPALASPKGSYGRKPAMSKGSGEMMAAHGHSAVAKIQGTQPGSPIQGMAKFTETENGVKVWAQVWGASPGKHGFHIHQNGSCTDGGKAAGGHYNPKGVSHGFFPQDGAKKAHAGDMGNIVIDDSGKGELTLELPGLSLEGPEGIAGRAVILHEKEDDFGQPTGNAGARIGCGIIQAAQDMPKGSY